MGTPIFTTYEVPGYRIDEVLGVVCGAASDGLAVAKLTGPGYINPIIRSVWKVATADLWTRALEFGADALVGVNYSMMNTGGQLSILATGTAVKMTKIDSPDRTD